LRQPSHEVYDFDDDFRAKLADLVEVFEASNIAVGLSAPQIGIQDRIAVVNIKKGKCRPHFVLVNPKIAKFSGAKETRMESCMSLPDFRGPVKRSKEITVEYQDQRGENHTLNAEGFLARVICHEVDHLDGILYVDRMDNLSELELVDFFKQDHGITTKTI